jgi:hypothetical protein
MMAGLRDICPEGTGALSGESQADPRAEHPDTLTSMGNLALMYQAQGKTVEAAALQEEVLEKHKRILGAQYTDVNEQPRTHVPGSGQDGGGNSIAGGAGEVHTYRRILGAEHPDMLTSMGNLTLTYQARGNTAEAAALQEEVLEKRRRILGAEHPDTLGNVISITTWGAGSDRYWVKGYIDTYCLLQCVRKGFRITVS